MLARVLCSIFRMDVQDAANRKKQDNNMLCSLDRPFIKELILDNSFYYSNKINTNKIGYGLQLIRNRKIYCISKDTSPLTGYPTQVNIKPSASSLSVNTSLLESQTVPLVHLAIQLPHLPTSQL